MRVFPDNIRGGGSGGAYYHRFWYLAVRLFSRGLVED